MRALVESWVKGEEAALLASKFYLAICCEKCSTKRFIPRKTIFGWRGIKGPFITFAVPNSLEDSRAAARHRGIDVVSFGKRTLRFLDESEVRLISERGKAIEIRISEVLEREKSIKDLKYATNLLLNKWVPTLFTCTPTSPFEVCVPAQILSLFESLDLKEEDVIALWGLGSNWIISLAERKGMKKVLRSE